MIDAGANFYPKEMLQSSAILVLTLVNIGQNLILFPQKLSTWKFLGIKTNWLFLSIKRFVSLIEIGPRDN
jgi:uncharacterized membrane protein